MRDWSLRSTLVSLLLTTSILTFVLVGALVLAIRLPKIEQEHRQQLHTEAIVLQQLVESFVSELENRLTTAGAMVGELPAAKRRALLSASLRDSGFQALYLVRLDGQVAVAVSRHAEEGVAVEGADFSALGLFNDALKNSGLAWSDRYPSLRTGEQVLALAQRAGDYVIIGESESGYLLDAIAVAAHALQRTVFVVDRRGEWLADNGHLRDHDRLRNWGELLQTGGERVEQLGFPLNGIFQQAAVRRSEKLDWTFIVAAPTGMNDPRYAATVSVVIYGFLGTLLFGSLLAILWAGRISLPIQAIIRHTHALALGDTATAAPRGRVREFNQLATDLDGMSQALEQRQQALLLSEERLRATLENAPGLAVLWFGEDGRIRYLNRAATAIRGMRVLEAIGAPFVERMTAAGASPDWQAEVACLLSGSDGGALHELALQAATGGELILLARLFSSPDAGGGRLFVCMGVDVTASRQAARALQASEQRFQGIFDASPLPMAVIRPAAEGGEGDRVVDVNQSWLQRFSLQRERVIDSALAELPGWRHGGALANALTRILADGEAGGSEARYVDAAGDERHFELTVRAAVVAGDSFLILVLNDVTEKKLAEEELRQLNQELEARVARRTHDLESANTELSTALERLRLTQSELVQADKLAALGGLVAGVAHELNTPIGNGLMAVTTLADQLQAFQQAMRDGLKRSTLQAFADDVGTGLEIAQRNLQRAAGFVASFKQVAVDQTSSQRRTFDLAELVGEILTTLHPMLKRLPYRVRTEVPAEIAMDSYPGPLGQVLTNLINNAVLHAFDGRDGGEILLRAECPDAETVRLFVSDDGNGVQPEVLDRIFDPFVTTKRGQGGTGLGLHIVYNAVSSILGGRITVCSAPGEGAEFVLLLPRVAPVAKLE